MATASCIYSSEELNFFRLVDLTVRIGSQAIRQEFELQFHPSELRTLLTTNSPELDLPVSIGITEPIFDDGYIHVCIIESYEIEEQSQLHSSLRTNLIREEEEKQKRKDEKKILNEARDQFYTTGATSVSYENFDITSMVYLLINFKKFQIDDPRTIYFPFASKAVSILRILYHRNQIVNSKHWKTGHQEFREIWNCVSRAILSLAPNLSPEVQNLATASLDTDKLKQLIKREEQLEIPRKKLDFEEIKKRLELRQQLIESEKNLAEINTGSLRAEGLITGLIHRPIEIPINLGIFSSTSYLESTLNSNGLDTSCIKLCCYIRDRELLKKLPLLDELANLDTGAGTDMQNSASTKNWYMRVVVLERDNVPEGQRDGQAVCLNDIDCAILRCFKETSESFENSIFVLAKSNKKYNLTTASIEIANFLKVDKCEIFKDLFHFKDKRIEERIEVCLVQILTNVMESQKDCLPKDKADILHQEIQSGKDAVRIHQFETVALRHESVNGFGRYKNRLTVFLKKNDMEEQRSVENYLKQYVGNTPEGFNLVVLYRESQIEKLTYFEQGSEVNSHKPCSIGAGTLGMFLGNKTDTYLTTCAHVIRRGQKAYSSKDHFELGVSVLAMEGPTENTKLLDFSLVKIIPEKNVKCDVGLRRRQMKGGYFDNGEIYKGNYFSCMQNKTLYKYGATVNYIETKFLGTTRNNDGLFIHVDKEGFAEPGDSGSLICFEVDEERGWAVFVLVAVDRKNKDCYQVCKVEDALDFVDKNMRQSIKPCLRPLTVKIPSQTLNGAPLKDEWQIDPFLAQNLPRN